MYKSLFGIIESVSEADDVLTVKSHKTGNSYKIRHSVDLPFMSRDVISLSCKDTDFGYIMAGIPLVLPGGGRKSVEEVAVSSFRSVFEAKRAVDAIITEVKNEKGSIYEKVCKLVVDNRELGLRLEGIKMDKFILNWYKDQCVRRLKLNGLTDDEITSALDYEYWNINDLYKSIIEEPHKILSISHSKCIELLDRYDLECDDEELDISLAMRGLFSKCKRWSCCPIEFHTRDADIEKLGCVIEGDTVYLPHQWRIEKIMLRYMRGRVNANTIVNVSRELDSDQREAVLTALNSKVTVITGMAGSGKSTVIGELIKHIDNYRVASFTGKAVSRLRRLVPTDKLSTLHSILFQDIEKFDYLIIDEATMVNDKLLADVLERIDNVDLRLVLIGDCNQLRPILPGDVFGTLIDKVPTVRLTTNHRVNRDSILFSNLENVVAKNCELKWGDDFKFIKGDKETVLELAEELTSQGIDHRRIKIVSPYNADLNYINYSLMDIYIPDTGERKDSYDNTWMKGCIVMHLKNNRLAGVMNGDEGEIIRFENDEMIVRINDEEIIYSMKRGELPTYNLKLSWAITVHKSQGSEWDIVVLYLPSGGGNFVNDKLMYTAMSRAKERLIVVGQSERDMKTMLKRRAEHIFSNLGDKLCE